MGFRWIKIDSDKMLKNEELVNIRGGYGDWCNLVCERVADCEACYPNCSKGFVWDYLKVCMA